MNVLLVVLLVVAAIVGYAIYQYKVEKKAREARYDKIRKRTDMSQPYNALTNCDWSHNSVNDLIFRPSHYSGSSKACSVDSHLSSYGSSDSYSDSSSSSSSSGSCD